MIDYTKRHAKRPARKRCAKCGAVGYYRNGTRRCRMRKFGAGSYCCWGELTPLRKPKAPKVVHAGDRFRERATRQAKAARKSLAKWQRKARLAEKLVHKWELRVAAAERKAQLTDDQVEQIADRMRHAATVQQVRRRIAKAAGVEAI